MPAASAPVFRLYLLRHAKAAWALPGQKDFDRTLDDTGYADAEIVADMAADKGLRPDLVLCSTAVRCRQTADALRRSMTEELDIRYVDELYSGSANVYRDIIGSQDPALSAIMLVGHNPVIEDILRDVIGEDAANKVAAAGYPPGALAAIDFKTRPGDGILPLGILAAWLDPDGRSR
ncbi:histidine phosphatase family protein [Rhizobium sp. Root483D2]|uniref:SixA phosphatase family protein n=1 Tax=Rhizobium sp. Root483D2 TaxID=1736545 RepID=UPI000712FCAC|nr:histidine phosphatase family protein [Rhizobium sp. Root483D2]KQY20904.1 phosphohistidine phosphatase [Rhizobium sp. Root483D2]